MPRQLQLPHRNNYTAAKSESHPDHRHLELIALEDLDARAQALAGSMWVERLWKAFVSENENGRLINSLTRALEAVNLQDEPHCAADLRLAIAIRLLDVKSGAVSSSDAVQIQTRGREIRPLQKWRLRRVIEYVDRHLSARITLSDMASVAGLSRMHFASQFRLATGFRPHQFLLKRRVRRAEELLQNTTRSIVEIALTVGFHSQAHLTTVFKQFIGSTPGRWRAINKASSVLPSRGGDTSARSSDVGGRS
jgi:AraC-like DNA-binding protein